MAQPDTIRVLHVIDTLGAAGAEHQLATLLPSLRRCGIESEVAVLRSPYTLQPLFEEQRIQVHRLELRDGRNFLAASSRLGRLLQRQKVDIVHAHLWHSIRATALSKVWSGREKRVLTFHNSEYQQFPATNPLRWLRLVFDRRILGFGIDHCTCVTRFIARSNEELLQLPPTQVIFNGLDLAAFPESTDQERFRVREQYKAGDDQFLIVTAGRLAEQKGQAVLIDAASRLKKEGADIRVLIFGEGPLKQKLHGEILKMGLESVVELAGAASHEQLFQAIAAADIFAFPSINEPFGLAAAEAMAIGTVVVASAVDGLPELIEDGRSGKLIPAGDAQALAQALHLLMNDPELRLALARAGRERARRLFDINHLSEELADFYRAALGKRAESVMAEVAT